MHIHDDLQDVIARDTGTAAFQADLSKRFGSYRLVRENRHVQQNLEKRLSALPTFDPETPVSFRREWYLLINLAWTGLHISV